MFSKIHFAGLVGKLPLLLTTVFCKEQRLHFLPKSFALESSSAGPTPLHDAWRETCKHPWDFLGLHKIDCRSGLKSEDRRDCQHH